MSRIDDHVFEGTRECVKVRKVRVGFVATAERARFRNIALWSAKLKP